MTRRRQKYAEELTIMGEDRPRPVRPAPAYRPLDDLRKIPSRQAKTVAPRRRIIDEAEPIPLGGVRPRRIEFAYARRLVRLVNEGNSQHAKEGGGILGDYIENGLGRALSGLNSLLVKTSVRLPPLASPDSGKTEFQEVDDSPAFWQRNHTPSVPLLLWFILQSPVLHRVRTCKVCKRFFVDEGKASRALYCSPRCASTAAIRAYRARSR